MRARRDQAAAGDADDLATLGNYRNDVLTPRAAVRA
jgi:hypothetical protein